MKFITNNTKIRNLVGRVFNMTTNEEVDEIIYETIKSTDDHFTQLKETIKEWRNRYDEMAHGRINITHNGTFHEVATVNLCFTGIRHTKEKEYLLSLVIEQLQRQAGWIR